MARSLPQSAGWWGASSSLHGQATVSATSVTGSRGSDTAPQIAGWVEPEWVEEVVSPEVRAVMFLPPGPELIGRLESLPRGPCRADHRAEAGFAAGRVERSLGRAGSVEVLVAHEYQPNGTRSPLPAPGSVPGIPCACQLVIAAAWAACQAWAAGRAADAVVDVAGVGALYMQVRGFGTDVDPAADELAAALHVSPRTATSRVEAARQRNACAAVAQVVEEGLLGSGGGSAVYEVLDHLPAETAAQVAAAVAGRIRDRRDQGLRNWTPAQARQAARAALLALAPALVEAAQEQARSDRRVDLSPVGDGTSWLSALLPEVDALRIFRRLTALAKAQAADAEPGDDRRMDQRRADLFTQALVCHGGTMGQEHSGSGEGVGQASAGGNLIARGGNQSTGGAACGAGDSKKAQGGVEVCVIATPETLLGLAETPALVPGLGPVPAALARELAADSEWRAWLLDAAGQVTAVDTGRYRPTAGVARLIAAREPVCRFPGCTVAVDKCDLDHTAAWPAAPGSSPQNLGPLCRRHHNAKTHHGASLTNQPIGWTWTMPSGLTHTISPTGPLGDELIGTVQAQPIPSTLRHQAESEGPAP